MAHKGGLGRGLASLIPQSKKTKTASGRSGKKSAVASKRSKPAKADGEMNYFGSDFYASSGSSGAGVQAKANPKTSKTAAGRKKPATKSDQQAVQEVDINLIVPNPHQPRKRFNEEKLSELAESIRQHGVLQPLVVSDVNRNGVYELIAGERRLQASKLAELETVPVILREATDQEKLELAMIENIQRHDLDPIEEARGYKQLQDLFGLTQEEVALKTGKSRSVVANGLRLLNLPIEAQKALINGQITEGHARSILSVTNPEKQRALLELILKEKWTVRKTESKVRAVNGGGHSGRVSETNPEIQRKENELTELLGTKVKIKERNGQGQVRIDFYSDEDLRGLINRLNS